MLFALLHQKETTQSEIGSVLLQCLSWQQTLSPIKSSSPALGMAYLMYLGGAGGTPII